MLITQQNPRLIRPWLPERTEEASGSDLPLPEPTRCPAGGTCRLGRGGALQERSSLLATFNVLAFLFHTILDLMDSRYQCIRQFLPRKRFFNDLRALTCYLRFDSWDALMAFMIKELELEPPDTS